MNKTYPYTIDNGQGELLTFTGITQGPSGLRAGADGVARPGAGPPMHVHYLQDEAARVVRGRLGYQVLGGEPQFAGPGETVVWSPRQGRRYDETTFSNNVMYPDAAPNPAAGFYMDNRADGFPLFEVLSATNDAKAFNNRIQLAPREWREYVPAKNGTDLQLNGYTQADDYRMMWKPMTTSGNITLDAFNKRMAELRPENADIALDMVRGGSFGG